MLTLPCLPKTESHSTRYFCSVIVHTWIKWRAEGPLWREIKVGEIIPLMK